MKPFKLTPAFKDYLWGGTRLKEEFGKKTDMNPLAESWELSAHPDGMCVIETGEMKGRSFAEFIAENPQAVGASFKKGDDFPLLIKLIDAAQKLSIQVHPNDEYAARVEKGFGKTEMWYILDCKPEAFLYFGFEHEISPEEFERRIADNTITDVLHRAPVKKGDVFFIEAGTIHAIGEGIVVAEVQQNSNLTYRVYDFGRLGADGKPRELHVKKAMEVTKLMPADNIADKQQVTEKAGEYTLKELVHCSRFKVDSVTVKTSFALTADEASFVSVLCTDGSGRLEAEGEALTLKKGDSAFIPAGCGSAAITGSGDFLITRM